MRKICLLFLFLIAELTIGAKSTYASNDFRLSAKVTYTINENALTHVVFNVILTNTTSKFFASTYYLDPGISDIRNISIRDPEGAISPKTVKEKNNTFIVINFASRVAGFGKKLPFTVAFDTTDVAKKEGKIWEINIPGLPTNNDYSDFNAFVNVPVSFGNPAYIKPQSAYQDIEFKSHTFLFSKSQLEASGISMGFGNKQVYSFSISYHIENSNLFPITKVIALPASTDYQIVSIKTISEKPKNVIMDKDGNWLAEYNLNPSQKLDITVKGNVEVFLFPQRRASGNLSDYLKSDPNWQADNPKISQIAKKLKTPKAIYSYVVNTLHYDFSRVLQKKPRLGALNALQNPNSAVCLEFTDLFIALARSSGIPAREIDGFAYTTNPKEKPLSLVKDVLHAWPEYYDYKLKQWIMVDPTWGSTTNGVDYFNIMDFDHVAFVTRGESSTYPIPAGGYKTNSGKNEKDIRIKFADNFYEAPSRLNLTIDVAKKSLSEFPINGSLIIQNTQGNLLSPQTIKITSEYLLPKNQTIQSPSIPPYGHVSIPFILKSPNFLTNRTSKVKITTEGKTFVSELTVVRLNNTILYIGGGIIFAILIASISLIATRTRNLPFFR